MHDEDRDWDRPATYLDRLGQRRVEGRPWPPHRRRGDDLLCSGCGATMRGKFDRCTPCTRRMMEDEDAR